MVILKRYTSLFLIFIIVSCVMIGATIQVDAWVMALPTIIVGLAAIMIGLGYTFQNSVDMSRAATTCFRYMPKPRAVDAYQTIIEAPVGTLMQFSTSVKDWVTNWCEETFFDTTPDVPAVSNLVNYKLINDYPYLEVEYTDRTHLRSMLTYQDILDITGYAVVVNNFLYEVYYDVSSQIYRQVKTNLDTGEITYQGILGTTDTARYHAGLFLVYRPSTSSWTIYNVYWNTVEMTFCDPLILRDSYQTDTNINRYSEFEGTIAYTPTIQAGAEEWTIPLTGVTRAPSIDALVNATPVTITVPGAIPATAAYDFAIQGQKGLNWTPLLSVPALYLSRFPFSIPADINNFYTNFLGDSKAPCFTLPFKIEPYFDCPIDVDFSPFNGVALIFRSCMYLYFLIGLMMFTPRFFGGV